MRLDKYLSEMNVGSRKELKKLIRSGVVKVNGTKITDPGTSVSESDEVTVAGQPISYRKYEYYMMNKPRGVITATEDGRQKTVLDLMDGTQRKDVFPVGRLDKDTVGLLLITNDGDLNHRLLSPKKHVDKEYYARIDGHVDEKDIAAFRRGLFIEEGFRALPAELTVVSWRKEATEEDRNDLAESQAPDSSLSQGVSEIRIVIQEGKYHQVKKMFHAVGKEVIYLKRIRMGKL
jgi:16S rRNA pseudouridine516 synthase